MKPMSMASAQYALASLPTRAKTAYLGLGSGVVLETLAFVSRFDDVAMMREPSLPARTQAREIAMA